MKELVCLQYLPNSESENQTRWNQCRVRSLFWSKLLMTGLFICIAVASVTGIAWAQAGQLDTTFATEGIFLVNPIGEEGGSTRVALQSDGKILIASAAEFNPDTSGVIVRLNPNGTLDKTFGLFGQVASVTSGGVFGQTGVAFVSSIVLQGDGKFIVAGAITSKLINPPGSNRTGFGLVRYNPSGSIDTTFGIRGGVLANFGANPNATAFALAIQINGDIIAAGQAGSSLALSRYTSAGTLDTTFGSLGTVTTSLGSNPSAISSLALQSDGKNRCGRQHL
jgi:uncharacterized delta-60 repeat protein